MENADSSSLDKKPAATGPGRLLRDARKELRLAPEDVAQMLHLSAKQITALEKDDFNSLPGSTYIRGYLRSYAQLLGLSPEKILDSYTSLMTPVKPLSLPKSAPPPQITSSDRLIKVATLGVSAIVLGLVYLWWLSDEAPTDQSGSSPAVMGQAPAYESDQSGTIASAPGAADNTTVTTALNQPPARAVVEPILQNSPHELPTTESAAASAPAPVAKSASAKQQALAGAIVNGSPSQPSKQTTTESAPVDRALTRKRAAEDIPPGVPRSRLVLHASQESWADVRDARDNKLLYENVPAGRSISIEGVAPFNVFLGNADGVRIEFNGQNFDVSRYRRGQVARFTLGETSAVSN